MKAANGDRCVKVIDGAFVYNTIINRSVFNDVTRDLQPKIAVEGFIRVPLARCDRRAQRSSHVERAMRTCSSEKTINCQMQKKSGCGKQATVSCKLPYRYAVEKGSLRLRCGRMTATCRAVETEGITEK